MLVVYEEEEELNGDSRNGGLKVQFVVGKRRRDSSR